MVAGTVIEGAVHTPAVIKDASAVVANGDADAEAVAHVAESGGDLSSDQAAAKKARDAERRRRRRKQKKKSARSKADSTTDGNSDKEDDDEQVCQLFCFFAHCVTVLDSYNGVLLCVLRMLPHFILILSC